MRPSEGLHGSTRASIGEGCRRGSEQKSYLLDEFVAVAFGHDEAFEPVQGHDHLALLNLPLLVVLLLHGAFPAPVPPAAATAGGGKARRGGGGSEREGGDFVGQGGRQFVPVHEAFDQDAGRLDLAFGPDDAHVPLAHAVYHLTQR